MGTRRPVAVALLTVSVVAASCTGQRPNPPAATPTSQPTGDALPEAENVRVADRGRWVETDCQMMPDDSFWHADVRDLPTMQPYTPDGSGLEGFPDTPELGFGINMRNENDPTPNWTDSSDPMQWVDLPKGFTQNSEFTHVKVTQLGFLRFVSGGGLRHRVPPSVLREQSSSDDHALFVDTDRCTSIEYIGWSRFPGRLEGNNATILDLETNERRLSSRVGWYTPANNGPAGDNAIDSPFAFTSSGVNGMSGIDMRGPRGAVTSSAGSGLAMTPGMLRLHEIFETPLPGDQSVDPDRRIDHALIAVAPTWHVRSLPSNPDPADPAPFVWPASRSDGCAGGTCVGDVAGNIGSDYSIPMGSRLRLREEKCNDDWEEPQAQVIADALCEHGVVITDTAGGFGVTVERSASAVGSKWRREADVELSELSIHDFELVDTGSVAAVDPHALWDGAVEWADNKYGDGAELVGGWYTGTFWGSLLACDRPVSSGDRVCTDRILSEVDAAVNSPDWFRVTQ